MPKVELSVAAIPEALISYMGGFLTPAEQSRLSACCKRMRSCVDTYLSASCRQRYPQRFNILEKRRWQVISWPLMADSLFGPTVVVSHHPYTRYKHGWEGRRHLGLTHENREWVVNEIWIVNQIWSPNESQKIPAMVRESKSCRLLEIQADGMTCYKISKVFDFHVRQAVDRPGCCLASALCVSVSLPHLEWKSMKLTRLAMHTPSRTCPPKGQCHWLVSAVYKFTKDTLNSSVQSSTS